MRKPGAPRTRNPEPPTPAPESGINFSLTPFQKPDTYPHMPSRKHFDPRDYSSYRFEPDGQPVRIAPVARGRSAGSAEFRPKPCRHPRLGEYFSLRRDDGETRIVSRATILSTCHPESLPPPQPRDPSLLPPRHFVIPGFEDYAVRLYPPAVFRFYNPNLGQLDPPAPVKCSDRWRRTPTRDYLYVGYSLIDFETGVRRFVTWDRILELAGFTPADVAAEQARVLSSSASASAVREDISHALSAL